jgi:hypothetical protein
VTHPGAPPAPAPPVPHCMPPAVHGAGASTMQPSHCLPLEALVPRPSKGGEQGRDGGRQGPDGEGIWQIPRTRSPRSRPPTIPHPTCSCTLNSWRGCTGAMRSLILASLQWPRCSPSPRKNQRKRTPRLKQVWGGTAYSEGRLHEGAQGSSSTPHLGRLKTGYAVAGGKPLVRA